MNSFRLMFICLISGSCAYSIHQVHFGDFDPNRKGSEGRIIKSQSSKFVFMGLNFGTEYVEDARRLLISQCPQGRIVGIMTKYSTDLNFLSWTNRIKMQGVCYESETKKVKNGEEEEENS